jgi:hypothetical protein
VLVLAHQGGWDEILLVLAPVSLFAFLLFVANRRAARLVELEDQAANDDDGAAPPE